MRGGQPLRFLAIVLGGWVTMRLALIVPQVGAVNEVPGALIDGIANGPVASAIPPPLIDLVNRRRLRLPAMAPVGAQAVAARIPPIWPGAARGDPDRIALAMLAFIQLGPAEPVGPVAPASKTTSTVSPFAPLLAAPDPAADLARRGRTRWSGAGWLVARAGQGVDPGLNGGQLGGGQAGARIAYAIGQARRVALVARAATPLSGPGREAAIGIEWRPTSLPVRLIAEQRIAIGRGNGDGGGGPSVALIGGIGPKAIGHGFRLEGYGAAGVIKRAQVMGFADGAVRIDHPIARFERVAVNGGAGAWGAAQTGTARLDIGPTLGADVPIADRNLRLSLDWRQRIAGQARPGSGIAFTIGTNF